MSEKKNLRDYLNECDAKVVFDGEARVKVSTMNYNQDGLPENLVLENEGIPEYLMRMLAYTLVKQDIDEMTKQWSKDDDSQSVKHLEYLQAIQGFVDKGLEAFSKLTMQELVGHSGDFNINRVRHDD